MRSFLLTSRHLWPQRHARRCLLDSTGCKIFPVLLVILVIEGLRVFVKPADQGPRSHQLALTARDISHRCSFHRSIPFTRFASNFRGTKLQCLTLISQAMMHASLRHSASRSVAGRNILPGRCTSSIFDGNQCTFFVVFQEAQRARSVGGTSWGLRQFGQSGWSVSGVLLYVTLDTSMEVGRVDCYPAPNARDGTVIMSSGRRHHDVEKKMFGRSRQTNTLLNAEE